MTESTDVGDIWKQISKEFREEAGLSGSQRGLQGIEISNTNLYAIDAVFRNKELFRRAEVGDNSSRTAKQRSEHLYMPNHQAKEETWTTGLLDGARADKHTIKVEVVYDLCLPG